MLSTTKARNMEEIFASVGDDKSLRIWDTRQKNPTFVEKTKEELLLCQFSNRDGTVLATSNYSDEICFWDARTWKIHKQINFPRAIHSLMWSNDDSVMFITDSNGRINLYDGQILEATSLNKPEIELSGAHSARCECICMHPNGQSFVSGSQDSLIVFWDFYELLSTGSVSTNDFRVKKLSYNSNGDYLAGIFYDEIQRKSQIEIFGANRQAIVSPWSS